MNKQTCTLTTPFEEGCSDWSTYYPRPQLRRDSFLSLCGEWDLFVFENAKEKPLGKIRVPFPPESRLSGLSLTPTPCTYIYRKTFCIDDSFCDNKVLLHFGAADQMTLVFVNGKFVGEHIGGYLPFSFEIQNFINQGENELRVEVTDHLDSDLPYGKQRYKRGGMWYTAISGIWQPVWLENVPQNYIQSIRFTPTLNSITLQINGGRNEKQLRIKTEHGEREYAFCGDTFTVEIEHPHLWSPEDPYLYHIELSDGTDLISSYFALRTISIREFDHGTYICLNDKPYFFHGLLDQGYFSDGIYLPASPQGYTWDVQTVKKLGFNMLRKHIKIEPEQFYYDCDRYGVVVFQDMVNNGKYHYIADTVLPTIGIKKRFLFPASQRRRKYFEQQALETVRLLYNHPCVCYYTVFNEGWGQYDSDRIYCELKKQDPTRIWDATSGWFAKNASDVVSEHVYFRKFASKRNQSKPLVLSEFGGYSYKVYEHSFNLTKNYGYKTFSTAKLLEDDLCLLYQNEIIPAIKKGLCASVLTQLSDVEDETNGLVTYDRQVVKVDENKMHKLSTELMCAFHSEVRHG